MFYSPSVFQRASRNGYAAPASAALASALNVRDFERFFDQATSGLTKSVRVEKNEAFTTLHIDTPGLAKDQLTIAIEADTVRIESKADAPRSFKAAYQLPHEIDSASSTAKLENGVLSLSLGKVVPVSRETVLNIQ